MLARLFSPTKEVRPIFSLWPLFGLVHPSLTKEVAEDQGERAIFYDCEEYLGILSASRLPKFLLSLQILVYRQGKGWGIWKKKQERSVSSKEAPLSVFWVSGLLILGFHTGVLVSYWATAQQNSWTSCFFPKTRDRKFPKAVVEWTN